ncbi:RES family NAD+ phosphorylase [Uliginosibacterium sp. H1]|uniref:RES family NAD+ phosphorylase n=1 Tax=Uliginosibacterium sp. H1 TaxID=3114757 RepID=UPI002E16E2E7|nr:RES family NAD+ phosphorylase [Uliginosibacterium sp. H1]
MSDTTALLACLAEARPVLLGGTAWRLVESQEQIATNRLVANLAEQALLEQMLETSKPRAPVDTARLHYLLATPFRYPPLPWGSRFGGRTEPGLFYASRSVGTVLAESAYYRYLFLAGMSVAPAGALTTQHTLFSLTLRSEKGLRLQAPPFDAWRVQLTDPADYRSSRALGSAMRAAGIEAFEFESARDPEHGTNLALFTPLALAHDRPDLTQQWLCETTPATVRYYHQPSASLWQFDAVHFMVEGRLPRADDA